MKVIMIGGYPGSGKSTIVREVLKRLDARNRFRKDKTGIVKWMENLNLLVLGHYELEDPSKDTFPGTDCLPMNVQPEAQRFLLDLPYGNRPVLLEGDRLFNESMLSFLQKHFNLILCIVSTEDSLLEKRRNARSKQNETWRKGRKTKVDRIAMGHAVHHQLSNNTKEEFESSVEELLAEVTGEWKSIEPARSKLKDLWS